MSTSASDLPYRTAEAATCKIAVDSLVKGEDEEGKEVIEVIESNYAKDVMDEFLKPIIVNGDEGRIKGQHSAFPYVN